MSDLRDGLIGVVDSFVEVDDAEAVVDAILAHPAMQAIREQAAAYRLTEEVD